MTGTNTNQDKPFVGGGSLEDLFSNTAYAEALEKAKLAKKGKTAFDNAGGTSLSDLSPTELYAVGDMQLKAAATVAAWLETSDLADNETYSQRLDALIMGQCDMDGNGEIGDAENDCYQMMWGFVGDYLQAKGASFEDVEAIANNNDDDAANRVMELVSSNMPDGKEAEIADMDSWAFDEDSTGSIFDSAKKKATAMDGCKTKDPKQAAMDATYKKMVAIRGGKKVRRNVRVSGTVHLSGAQKAGLKKAQMKSHSATAQMHRAKSMAVRAKMGL